MNLISLVISVLLTSIFGVERMARRRLAQYRRAWFRPQLEILEGRVVPATPRTLTFVGDAKPGANLGWDQLANWIDNGTGGQPTASPEGGDTLIFANGAKSTSVDDITGLKAVVIKMESTLDRNYGIVVRAPLLIAGGYMKAGRLTGAGAIEITSNSTFTWSGGFIGGSGVVPFVGPRQPKNFLVDKDAHLVISGGNTPLTLSGRVLSIAAPTAPPTTTWVAGQQPPAAYFNSFEVWLKQGSLKLTSGSQIINGGSFIITSPNQRISGGSSSKFNNNEGGLLDVVLQPAQSFTFVVPLNNASKKGVTQITVHVGKLSLAAGGSLSGTIGLGLGSNDASQNAEIDFSLPLAATADVNYTWADGFTFVGGGIVYLFGVRHLNPPNTIGRYDAVVTVMGTVRFADNIDLSTDGGSFHGPGTVSITNSAVLHGLLLSGPANGSAGVTLEVDAGGDATFMQGSLATNQNWLAPGLKYGAHLVVNSGTVTMDATGGPGGAGASMDFTMYDNSTILVKGTAAKPGTLILKGRANIRPYFTNAQDPNPGSVTIDANGLLEKPDGSDSNVGLLPTYFFPSGKVSIRNNGVVYKAPGGRILANGVVEGDPIPATPPAAPGMGARISGPTTYGVAT